VFLCSIFYQNSLPKKASKQETLKKKQKENIIYDILAKNKKECSYSRQEIDALPVLLLGTKVRPFDGRERVADT
jgi:hypothetical protein